MKLIEEYNDLRNRLVTHKVDFGELKENLTDEELMNWASNWIRAQSNKNAALQEENDRLKMKLRGIKEYINDNY